MGIKDEAETALTWMDKRYQRALYGTPMWRNRERLSLETEWQLAERRRALIVMEHCPSWVALGKKP